VRYAYLMQEVVLALIVEATGLVVAERPFEPYQGHIEVPGGKREAHESLRLALQRELLEELGLLHFEAHFFFQVDVSKHQRLVWFVVKPLSDYHKGIYTRLMLVNLNQLTTLNWIPHNLAYLPYLQSVITLPSSYTLYVYPTDNPIDVVETLQAHLSDPTSIKKQPFGVFKGCMARYQLSYPDLFEAWPTDLVES